MFLYAGGAAQDLHASGFVQYRVPCSMRSVNVWGQLAVVDCVLDDCCNNLYTLHFLDDE